MCILNLFLKADAVGIISIMVDFWKSVSTLLPVSSNMRSMNFVYSLAGLRLDNVLNFKTFIFKTEWLKQKNKPLSDLTF